MLRHAKSCGKLSSPIKRTINATCPASESRTDFAMAHKLLAEFIARNSLPLRLVSCPVLDELFDCISKLNRKYKAPSRERVIQTKLFLRYRDYQTRTSSLELHQQETSASRLSLTIGRMVTTGRYLQSWPLSLMVTATCSASKMFQQEAMGTR